ncbi:MAG: 4-hydroxy-tetrahydrodipicolinate reductase [Armatimonadetes bacterium]|nr:4-hydroxy-tetrahydrodipicolinate reductase [Armatimonadota bacterium]
MITAVPDVPVRITVVGAAGKFGREIMRRLKPVEGVEIVAAIDLFGAGERCRDVISHRAPDLVIEDKTGASLDRLRPDVLVDVSNHGAAAQHALSAIKRGIPFVIGASGLSSDDLQEIEFKSREAKVPGIYCPVLSIGAVLMIRFSEMTARYLPQVEIIEMQSTQEKMPTGLLSQQTAEMIAKGRREGKHAVNDSETAGKCEQHCGVKIHAVRLQGLHAHQRVLFSGRGETFVLQHDSLDYTSYLDGLRLAIFNVASLDSFVVGLENLMFEEGRRTTVGV